MAPTSSTMGLILPRTVCHDRHGCGSIRSDKLPIIIAVVVVVAIIIVTIYWCSFRSMRAKKRSPGIKNAELAPGTAPHAVREVPAPTTATAGEARGATWHVAANGLNPLVPPPMYEETPPPPPTYQRDAQAPRYA